MFFAPSSRPALRRDLLSAALCFAARRGSTMWCATRLTAGAFHLLLSPPLRYGRWIMPYGGLLVPSLRLANGL